MDIFPIPYYSEDYYEDGKDSSKKYGNRISRLTLVKGMNNISTNGHVVIRERAVVRGDLAKIYFGKISKKGSM